MKSTLRAALLGGFFCLGTSLCAGFAHADVLTFDDLGSAGTVPLHYGGLDWSGAGWLAFGDAQPPFTAHSGNWRLATDFGIADAASEIRFATPTVFNGAWFAGLGGATVSFQLYAQGQLVASSATLDPNEVPAFLASGFAGQVDAVRVHSPWHASFVMDDFSFTSAVPEPQSWLLMGLGLAALAARASRGNRTAPARHRPT
jgi:hypothetical protein